MQRHPALLVLGVADLARLQLPLQGPSLLPDLCQSTISIGLPFQILRHESPQFLAFPLHQRLMPLLMHLVGIILRCRQAAPQILDSPFEEEDTRVVLDALFPAFTLKDTQNLTKRISLIPCLRIGVAPVDLHKRLPGHSELRDLHGFLLAMFIHKTATVAAAEGAACHVMQQPFPAIVIHKARLIARHPELEVDAHRRPLEATRPRVGKPISAERQGAQEHPAVAQDAFAIS